MSDITARYQQQVASICLSLSPQLAALHASRNRLLNENDSISPSPCPRCGSNRQIVRLIRERSKKRCQNDATNQSVAVNGRSIPPRARKTSCLVCGHVHKTPIARGAAVTYPPVRSQQKITSTPNMPSADSKHYNGIDETPQKLAPELPRATPALNPGSSSNATKKKKPTSQLQELLSKARQRDLARATAQTHNGLAAFLSDLN